MCALEAEVSCLCSEIEEPRLTSKRPTVRAAARTKYEARKLACVPCNGDLAREPPKRNDVFDYAADDDDAFLGSGDELHDDSDSDPRTRVRKRQKLNQIQSGQSRAMLVLTLYPKLRTFWRDRQRHTYVTRPNPTCLFSAVWTKLRP